MDAGSLEFVSGTIRCNRRLEAALGGLRLVSATPPRQGASLAQEEEDHGEIVGLVFLEAGTMQLTRVAHAPSRAEIGALADSLPLRAVPPGGLAHAPPRLPREAPDTRPERVRYRSRSAPRCESASSQRDAQK